MTSPSNILQQAKKQGFELYLHEGLLKCKVPVTKQNSPLIGSIKANKDALQSLLLDMQRVSKQTIPTGNTMDGLQLPLSANQEALFYHCQLQPDSHVYNMPFRLDIAGQLDVESLSAALTTMLERHRILRTRYESDINGVCQVSEPVCHSGFSLQISDLSDLGKHAIAAAEQAAVKEAHTPFDLSEPAMLRVRLLTLNSESHVLLVTLHHIAADAWSVAILLKELNEIYHANCKGQNHPLPAPGLQYADYALWQKQNAAKGLQEPARRFWRDHLNPVPTPLPLKDSQSMPEGEESTLSFLLNQDESAALRNLAKELGITVYRLALSAFVAALSVKAQRDRFVITTTSTYRENPQLAGAVGYLVNLVPLVFELAEVNTWRELVHYCHSLLKQNLAMQDLSYGEIISSVSQDAGVEVGHINKINFEYVALDFAAENWRDLDVTIRPCAAACVKQDVNFTFRDDGKSEIYGSFQYKCNEVPEATAKFLTIFWRDAISALLKDLDSNWRTTPTTTSTRLLNITCNEERSAKEVLSQKNHILQQVQLHGAIRINCSDINNSDTFGNLMSDFSEKLFAKNGEHDAIVTSNNVFTPVAYDQSQKVLWHNENSFNQTFPDFIAFGSLKSAESGGATTLVDSRVLYRYLPAELKSKFENKNLIYERTFLPGMGRSWQEIYATDCKDELTELCLQQGIEIQWLDGDILQTRSLRPAVLPHPITGEKCWINQVLHWHTACLDPDTKEAIEELFPGLSPRACFLGDGSEISEQEIATIISAYESLEWQQDWQDGDIMIVDNHAMAHAREPYTGKRELIVSMGSLGYEQNCGQDIAI